MKQTTNRRQSLRRIAALEMPLAGILIQTMIYAWLWFSIYYPLVRLRLKFYLNGHILVLLLYFILLLFLTKTYGGMDVGYQKPFDVSLSQIFSLLIVNAFTYLQDSLMRNWILPLGWALLVTLVQILFAVLWIQISDKVYHKVFPPTKMILIYGERNAEPILKPSGKIRHYEDNLYFRRSSGYQKSNTGIRKNGGCPLGYSDSRAQ